MKILTYFEPFPHIILEEVFTPDEYKLIWEELLFLAPKMRSPNETSAAADKNGIFMKKGVGIPIEDVYKDLTCSDIAMYSQKFLNVEIAAKAMESELYFLLYNRIYVDSILVQMYKNGDYYKSHHDYSVFSAVTLMHKNPKKYHGGDIKFANFNFTPKHENNSTIIFPSMIDHEVTEVYNTSSSNEDARFTITSFLTLARK